MYNTLFSVIVPVFNTAPYLQRCIDSIILQDYQSLEIILIDDGSTDRSPSICDDYAEKDNRIKVVHKKNEGLSAARNDGILLATGDYIMFVDSDDFIQPNTFKTIDEAVKKYSNIDVLTGNCIWVEPHKSSNVCFHHYDTPTAGYEFLIIQRKNKSYRISACLYIVNRQFILNNQLFFLKGFLCEDNYWCPKVILAAQKVFTLNFTHYNYIMREDSLTISFKTLRQRIKHIMEIAKMLETDFEQITDTQLRSIMMEHLVNTFFSTFILHRQCSDWREYQHLFNISFIRNKVSTAKNKKRYLLYSVSPSLFYYYKKVESYAKNFTRYISSFCAKQTEK